MEALVRTQHGMVRGTSCDGVRAFKGIPYAAPPFGANRFLPPQPVEPWSGVRDAIRYGAKPPGMPYVPGWDVLIPELDVHGDDCLTLNVWTPEPGSTGLPVMVWFPGGIFEHGTSANPSYDGSRFARDGIVCVTINYRAAADGFLHFRDGNSNRGLLDQLAALEWVQTNIAGFGGDPGNVTLFGQSAGAMSIGTMLALPQAEDAFRRAILQSGGGHQVTSVESAQKVGQRLADALGVDFTREAMAGVPLDRLIESELKLKAELVSNPDPGIWGLETVMSSMLWQPVLDGKIIDIRPIDRIRTGASAIIDLMVGSNSDEWNFMFVPDGMIDQISPAILAASIPGYGLPVDEALSAYRVERPGATDGELLSAILSDWYFRIPALQVADAHATGAGATYAYEFNWKSPEFDGRLGAAHGVEIPFVFDTLSDQTDPLLGPNPPQALADAMHAAWVSFAKTGTVGWPRYDLCQRATMRFDTRSAVVHDPRSAVRSLWEGIR